MPVVARHRAGGAFTQVAVPPARDHVIGVAGSAATRQSACVLSADEMPNDNADLSAVAIEFPRLPDDSPSSCPVTMSDLLEYLHDEVPGGDSLGEAALSFQRTANVEGTSYWIWRFDEPDGGESAYATVSAERGSVTLGYETDYYGLSPEQFILGDYYQVF